MSESIIQKQTGLQGLSTAILLPSVSLFGEPAGLYADEVGPLTSVVGIGLFQRTVLTLQRAGIRQLMVLVGPEEDQLKQALGKGPRLTIPAPGNRSLLKFAASVSCPACRGCLRSP